MMEGDPDTGEQIWASLVLLLLWLHDNSVKFSENLDEGNLLKICLKYAYPIEIFVICSRSYFGKSENIRNFKTHEYNCSYTGSLDIVFAMNPDKRWTFILSKAPSENDFLKDVKSKEDIHGGFATWPFFTSETLLAHPACFSAYQSSSDKGAIIKKNCPHGEHFFSLTVDPFSELGSKCFLFTIAPFS